MTFDEYINQLLLYVRTEKELIELDIKNHSTLPDKEKIEHGYLIKDSRVTAVVDDC